MIYHKHLILNSRIRKPFLEKQTTETQLFLIDLVSKLKMKILFGPIVRYVITPGNRGMTAIVLIETSHIAFHIWDEAETDETKPFIRMDIYTCGTLDERFVIKLIDDQFGLVEPIWWLLDRADEIEVVDTDQ